MIIVRRVMLMQYIESRWWKSVMITNQDDNNLAITQLTFFNRRYAYRKFLNSHVTPMTQ